LLIVVLRLVLFFRIGSISVVVEVAKNQGQLTKGLVIKDPSHTPASDLLKRTLKNTKGTRQSATDSPNQIYRPLEQTTTTSDEKSSNNSVTVEIKSENRTESDLKPSSPSINSSTQSNHHHISTSSSTSTTQSTSLPSTATSPSTPAKNQDPHEAIELQDLQKQPRIVSFSLSSFLLGVLLFTFLSCFSLGCAQHFCHRHWFGNVPRNAFKTFPSL
jgi:hypothetical protein